MAQLASARLSEREVPGSILGDLNVCFDFPLLRVAIALNTRKGWCYFGCAKLMEECSKRGCGQYHRREDIASQVTNRLRGHFNLVLGKKRRNEFCGSRQRL